MYDLYTLGTPNGWKASIMLEELQLPYDVHRIDITQGDQFKEDFIKINPNSKIPALVDKESQFPIMESVAILMYLGEKHESFLPKDRSEKYKVIQWSIFQAASVGPMFGQFGHFKVYAKEKIDYAINRYQKESLRLMGVIDQQLGKSKFIANDDYSIADIAIWPWLHGYTTYYKESLDKNAFPHLVNWYEQVAQRPAVQKGIQVPSS